MNANDTIRGDTYRVRYQLPRRPVSWELVARLTRKPPGGVDRIDQPTDEFTLVGTPAFGAVILQRSWLLEIEPMPAGTPPQAAQPRHVRRAP